MTKLTNRQHRQQAVLQALDGNYVPLKRLIDKLREGPNLLNGVPIIFDYDSILEILQKRTNIDRRQAVELYEHAVTTPHWTDDDL